MTRYAIIKKRVNTLKVILRLKRRSFLLFMPIYYQQDEMLKKLTAKSNGGEILKRLSDARVAVYGNGRASGELAYLKGQNTDAVSVNTHLPDAWDTFAGARGVTGTNTYQETHRKKQAFFRTQSYP